MLTFKTQLFVSVLKKICKGLYFCWRCRSSEREVFWETALVRVHIITRKISVMKSFSFICKGLNCECFSGNSVTIFRNNNVGFQNDKTIKLPRWCFGHSDINIDKFSPLAYPTKVPKKLTAVNEAKFACPEKNVIGKEDPPLNE